MIVRAQRVDVSKEVADSPEKARAAAASYMHAAPTKMTEDAGAYHFHVEPPAAFKAGSLHTQVGEYGVHVTHGTLKDEKS